MDINMKDVKLGKKENDNWIYIATEMTANGLYVKEGTKLLVDDGTKSLAQYQAEVKNLANKNSWDKWDDLAMLIDFALTLEGSKSMSLKEFL